ncbi:MAG: GAF domain-containing protein [Spirochaetia bacterium]|nr:GAF domain-containing protein [Spirochaetia bacterium]
MDTAAEAQYDELVALASLICGTPIALLSIITKDRQWFKARVGLDATETSRDVAFCSHAILEEDIFTVEDATADARFADNPLVVENPNIRFYAGAQLRTMDGQKLGTLCVIDRVPRKLTGDQIRSLEILSRQASELIALRNARDAAITAARARSEFLAIVSHELRTPLSGVIGMASLLADTKLDEDQSRYVSAIQQSGERLNALLTNVLDFSRLESGGVSLHLQPTSPHELVDGIVNSFKEPARIKKLSLEVKIDPAVAPSASLDSFCVRDILSQLLRNAIQFTESGSVELSLQAGKEDGFHILDFCVRDTGPGISPDVRKSIFDAFAGKPALAKGANGIRLGLALAQRLAKLHQGHIRIDDGFTQGASVHFICPVG